MADYTSTVGVQLTDDFSQLSRDLQMITAQVKQLKTTINQLTRNAQKLKSVMNGTKLGVGSNSSVKVSIRNINGQTVAYKQQAKAINDLGNQIKKTNKLTQGMFDLNKLYFYSNYLKQVFRGLGNTIKSAMDFTETENLFANAMGGMYKKAMTFQKQLNEMYGTAMNSTMNAQATFKNQLGVLGNGLGEELEEQLSETLTQMSLDFSSLYNVGFEESLTKFQSALSKQVRPIRSKSGFDITQATLTEIGNGIGMSKTYSELSELEKRLLIIIALEKQMGEEGSNASGDLARTIEQPSNQLRVLQEQLHELGQWFGAIFYPLLKAVLPYINGIVMAIKEMIKALATLIGYEMPDTSSAGGGTILDQLGDESETATDGVKDTTKAVKELKKSVAGFDALNIITKPSESSDSGGGNDSPTGGGGIDPAILEALKGYDGVLANVRMKALDVRDAILTWANEKIFEPFKNSWDKYGKTVTENWGQTFGNIGQLFSGIGTTINNNLAPYVESASGLFLTLLGTVGVVADGISTFFLTAFNGGGNTLLEGIMQLATALNTMLATALNNVNIALKPIVTFVSELGGSLLGVLLGLIGNLLKKLAELVTWLTQNETAMSIISGLLSGLMVVIGFIVGQALLGKFVVLAKTLFGNITTLAGGVSKFFGILAGNPILLVVAGIVALITTLVTLYKNSETFRNFVNGLWEKVKGFWEKIKKFASDLITKVGEIKEKVTTKASEIWEKIKKTFSIDNVKKHFENVIKKIKEVFENIPNWFEEKFSKAWKKVKDVFSTGGKIFSGIKEGIGETFTSLVKKIASGLNKIIKVPFDGINGMLNKIREVGVGKLKPFKDLWSYNPLTVPQINIDGFAKGGFPKAGELFMARENGIPELVGSFGGKSMVANNVQIEKGIADAIKEANAGANGNGDVYLNNIVQIGGETIEKQVTKANKRSIMRTGKPLLGF